MFKSAYSKSFACLIGMVLLFSACTPKVTTVYPAPSPTTPTSVTNNPVTVTVTTTSVLPGSTIAKASSTTPVISLIPSLLLPTLRIFQNSDTHVWGWGANVGGIPGQGVPGIFPQVMNNFSGIITIAGGYGHVLAVKSDGSVWGWGNNSFGQAASSFDISLGTPALLKNISGPVQLSAGNLHSLALMSDGTVFAWGNNEKGQLGNGTTVNSFSPVNVLNLNNVVAISSGHSTNLALRKDGTVWGWGDGANGQLGSASTVSVNNKPVQINGLSNIVSIAAGSTFSLALKSDGTVWAWGINTRGQLGDGTTQGSNIPVKVSGLTGITAIATGYNFGLALKKDGTVWCWGNDTYGELGNGIVSTSPVPNPVQVAGLTGASAIYAGNTDSCAFAAKSDGTLWAWGQNSNGQLGVGNINDSATPAKVTGVSNVIEIAGGQRNGFAFTVALVGK